MTSQNCFLCFYAIRNLLFQNFLFPSAFDNKDVLFKLNSNDDTTLKRLNLDFQLPLYSSFKIDIKMGRF